MLNGNGAFDLLFIVIFCFSIFFIFCIYHYYSFPPLFSKATTLERTYGPAWIAYGHSFAVESEHDQAMAAYFTAAQLMKGCVRPYVLY